MRLAADELLQAFAHSDLAAIERLCADDILLWGTDEGETWRGKDEVLRSLAGAFDLGVHWLEPPVVDTNWVAGVAEFTLDDGTAAHARVTMVFREGLLAHAHYSLAVTA